MLQRIPGPNNTQKKTMKLRSKRDIMLQVNIQIFKTSFEDLSFLKIGPPTHLGYSLDNAETPRMDECHLESREGRWGAPGSQ